MDKKNRTAALIIVVLLIVGAIWTLELQKVTPGESIPSDVSVDTSDERIATKAQTYPLAKDISTPDGFINTDSISIQDLIGKKVILVDFWTYSCINCQRTTPYLNAWYDTYKDHGLEIVGIHTPEFEFEKVIDNVRQATIDMGITFPVVLDNDFSTWRAYENRYWPHKYLIDIDGFIVYDHIGEGSYDETEENIRVALEERARILGTEITMASTTDVDAIDVDFSQVRSPETYVGAQRNNLGNGRSGELGEQVFSYPNTTKADRLYFNGTWTIDEENGHNTHEGEGGFQFTFEAKNVYMVASGTATIRIIEDGIDKGTMTIDAEQLYSLIEENTYGTHTLEIRIESGTLTLYTLTFG